MNSWGICHSQSDLFYLMYYTQGSSMLLQTISFFFLLGTSFYFPLYWEFCFLLPNMNLYIFIVSTIFTFSTVFMSSVKGESLSRAQSAIMNWQKAWFPLSNSILLSLLCRSTYLPIPCSSLSPCLYMQRFTDMLCYTVDCIFQVFSLAAWNNWQKFWNFHLSLNSHPLILAQGKGLSRYLYPF